MAITFNKVRQQVALLLGAIEVEGDSESTAESNYTGTQSTTTLRSVDFPPTAILDAVIVTVEEVAEVICKSQDPEHVNFLVQSSATGSGNSISISSGSVPRIGPIRRVRDSSNNRTLKKASISQVRDFNNDAASFAGYTAYFYAEVGNSVIEHTRTNVIATFCGFTRASLTVNLGGSDVIPLNDGREKLVVAGATARLAAKEGMFADLCAKMSAEYQEGLARILSYPELPPTTSR